MDPEVYDDIYIYRPLLECCPWIYINDSSQIGFGAKFNT